jgi:hypothetical protein
MHGLEEKKTYTAQPIREADCSSESPEFGRVADVQRLFGVRRGILYRWIQDGRVKSVLIREPGNKQGIRLIYLASVRDFIHSQMEDKEVALSA